MKKRTKALQFSKKTIIEIMERDQECIPCKLGYSIEGAEPMELQTMDPMHVVNKSKGGLGVKENGVRGCRYHHHLLDNGNKGLRQRMIEDLEQYLKDLYPGWSRESVTYQKYNFTSSL